MSGGHGTGENILLTIRVSHYCEKARWALERAGVPYREEVHVPPFTRLVGRRYGAWSTVPVLVTPSATVAESSAIVRWADARAAAGRRLFPEGAAERREVEVLEARFDDKLGPHTRRLLYWHLLPERDLTVELLGSGAPAWEARVLRAAFPALRAMMRRGMRVNADGAARSTRSIDEIFGEVAARLEGGRRYLVGERFTVADLTFASLAAPILAPPGYGAPLPPVARMPAAMRDIVEAYRASPAGAFALRMFAEERRPIRSAAA